MRTPRASSHAASIVLLLTGTACHDHDGEVRPLIVSSVQPAVLLGYRPAPVTVTGSGFTRTSGVGTSGPTTIGGDVPESLGEVTVTFRTTDGTPFANGTAAEAQATGTVTTDSVIQVTSPITNATGVWLCTIEVSDECGSGASATPIAEFAGLTVFDVSTPEIPADRATPFDVLGLSFPPALGVCTVRFTAVSPATFPGGALTLDVAGTIDSVTRVSGTTPVLALTAPVPAFVTVILDGEPGAPQATSSCVLLKFVPPPLVPVVVSTITSPLQLAVPTPFTITGSGFLGASNPNVAVTFRAASGTPAEGGTAAEASVLGNAVSDTTITGTSPIGTSPTDVTAFVTVARADGIEGTSATDIALFTAPSSGVLPGFSGFSPTLLPADVRTAFTITGTNLPAPGTATVRFRAIEGTPFTGGTTETVDVTANITSSTQLGGASPLATTTAPFLAQATVILPSGVALPLGVCSLFYPPGPAPSTCSVTNLNDSGAGSLRQAILDAAPDCIIMFDTSLSGDLAIDSTLVVPRSVHVLGPGPDVIRVTAQQNDYPAFTIEPSATGTIVEQLSIRGSHHRDDGGGFVVRGGLTLARCELAGHRVDADGACVFVASAATAVLKECTMRDSRAGGRGGGVFAASGATVQVVGCTLSDNEAGAGGAGIGTDTGSAVEIANSTFFRNTGTGGPGGGAILVSPDSTVSLLHCTLAQNSTHNRGGGAFVQGTLNATNCIFARNSDGKCEPEISNQNGTNNTTFSLVRVGLGSGLTNGADGNLVGTPEQPVDAELGPIQWNGGPTRTMALQPDSPALDAATASAATKDQRGVARPQASGPDMGAFEATVDF